MMCLDWLRMVVVNYITAHLFGELFVALEASRGALELQLMVVDNASCAGCGHSAREIPPC